MGVKKNPINKDRLQRKAEKRKKRKKVFCFANVRALEAQRIL